MKLHHLQHVFWRAGFGIGPQQMRELSKQSRAQVVKTLIKNSQHATPLVLDTKELDDFIKNIDFKTLSEKKKAEFNKKSRQKVFDLNDAWVNRLVSTNEDLRERMTLFWANHFVCRDTQIYHIQQYNNTLRRYALGNFGDFLKAISKEASMLKYLNLRQNRKSQPNENFARELMELFTLGVGHYSEKDIKEIARAFTGYNHHLNGEFVLRTPQHDEGIKTVFGRSGNFDGDAIIDLLLEQKQCARFVCGKIYQYFVNSKVNEAHVTQMAEVFYKDYDIENLMRFVFMSDWFYDDTNIGVKIKSPIDYLVGLARTVPFKVENKRMILRLQRILGQVLLDPPNVAGWKGGTAWIDVNTIMLRMRLPSVLLNNAMIALPEDSQETQELKSRFFKNQGGQLPFKSQPQWEIFLDEFKKVPTEELHTYILSSNISNGTKVFMKEFQKIDKKQYCIQLMSMPEYQMC